MAEQEQKKDQAQKQKEGEGLLQDPNKKKQQANDQQKEVTPSKSPQESPRKKKKKGSAVTSQEGEQFEIEQRIMPAEENKEAEDQNQQEVESIKAMPVDFYYPENHKEKEMEEREGGIHKKFSKYYCCFGFDVQRRYNMYLLDDNTIVYILGQTYHIYNLTTKETKVFFAKEGKGIGSIAIHPEKKWFAVGEKGVWPNAYIYEYPSLRLYRILRKGTETAYSDMCWSNSGTKLATVGSYPDYMLTIWDWSNEQITLKCKAFSQEIYKVEFSPNTEENLTTCGMGHIRFWRMAKTFTGLKLQGEIGKFGQIELSDILAFAELPDGKVLSGSEYGNLLLWEGNLIKALLTRETQTGSDLCHNGNIDVIYLKDNFITAGYDGYLRWWDFNTIDLAEPEEGFEVTIPCLREVAIGGQIMASIKYMIEGSESWLQLDNKGAMWKVMKNDYSIQQKIKEFHSGRLVGLGMSQTHNAVVTLASDGSIRVWNLVTQKEEYVHQTDGKGSCLEWAQPNGENQGRIFSCGFEEGVIRVFLLDVNCIKLIKAFKGHDTPVKMLRYSFRSRFFLSCGNDNSIFFYKCAEDNISAYTPICQIQIEEAFNDIKWNHDGKYILLAFKSGIVRQYQRPEQVDTEHSYLVDLKYDVWQLCMAEWQVEKEKEQLLKELEQEEEDLFNISITSPSKQKLAKFEEWEIQPILAISYDIENKDQFWIATTGNYKGYIYLCSFQEARPLKTIPCTEANINVLKFTHDEQLMISGCVNGSVQIRYSQFNKPFMNIQTHDINAKIIQVCINQKNHMLVAASEDGAIFTYEIFPEAIKTAATGGAGQITTIEELDYKNTLEIYPQSFVESEDVTGTILSIQAEKLKKDEDSKQSAADKVKDSRRAQIQKLKQEFVKLQAKNQQLDRKYQLTQEEMNVDPDYETILKQKREALIQEVQKEFAWELEFHQLECDKLTKYFLDEIAMERFTLKCFKFGQLVTGFRVSRLSAFLQQNLAEIKSILQEETKAKASLPESESESMPISSLHRQVSNVEVEQQAQKEQQQQQQTQPQKQEPAKTDNQSITKQRREERTKSRERRQKEIQAILDKEEEAKKENPNDIRNIEIAKATMGDKKLKSAPDYEVPEQLRMNVAKKRRQMLLLEESILNQKTEFNNRLLSMRDLKGRLIEKIKIWNARIREINEELAINQDLVDPQFEPCEWPEHYYLISAEDIEAAEAKQGKEESEASKSYFEADMEEEEDEDQESAGENKKQTPAATLRKKINVTQTTIEKQFQHVKNMQLQAEKTQLEKEIENTIQGFDQGLEALSDYKMQLSQEIKMAEMKLVTHYEELLKLYKMEPQDIELTSRIQEAENERKDILYEQEEILKRYEKVKAEADEVEKKKQEVYAQFHELVSEGHQFYDDLWKILQTRVKRKKQNEDESNASSDFSDEELEDEEEEEDLQAAEKCPPGCDMNIFDHVQMLRDQRQDVVDEANEKKQSMAELKKQHEQAKAREEVVNGQITVLKKEMSQFQREKLKKLNKLSVVVPLQFSQIFNLINEGIPEKNDKQQEEFSEEHSQKSAEKEISYANYFLPQNLENSILITSEELQKLTQRIQELKEEVQKEKKNYENLYKESTIYQEKLKKADKEKQLAQKEFDGICALRFGHAINLDYLSQAQPSTQLENLKIQFKQTEAECLEKIRQAQIQVSQAKKELASVTSQNTDYLNRRHQLLEEIVKTSKELDATSKHLFEEEDEAERVRLEKEKQKMKELLELQAREIETLKTEISLFRRKGGHIYTTVTANRKASQS